MATASERLPRKTPRNTRERIDVRLCPEQKTEIERAAQIKGLTVTDFMVQQAVDCARRTIREYETWTLSRPDAALFAAALMAPATIGTRLSRAATRYKKRIATR